MRQQPQSDKMKWAVLVLSALILIISVAGQFFDRHVDTGPAFYLFGTVSALVFGATFINKLKE